MRSPLLVLYLCAAIPVAHALEIGLRGGYLHHGQSVNLQKQKVPNPGHAHHEQQVKSQKETVPLSIASPQLEHGQAKLPGSLKSRNARVDPVMPVTKMWLNKTETRLNKTQSALPVGAVPKKELVKVAVSWLILSTVSMVEHRLVRGTGWDPKRRAPYTAAIIVLWAILVFATLFHFLSAHNWSWMQCIYFCIVTFTTVGYGDYVPRDSLVDKVLLIVFIWVNLLVISVVWSIVLACFEEEIDALEGSKHSDACEQILILAVFIFSCAALFMYLESWSFLQAITYVSVTVTTVGYGHLLPNDSATSMICASFLMLVGVPLTAVCTGKIGAAVDERFKERKEQMGSSAQLGVYITLILIWLLVGGAGFYSFNIESWSMTECLYLAAVTMTTVGYGDYAPTTTVPCTLFCIFYVWGSVCAIGTVFNDLDKLLIDLYTKGLERHKAMLYRSGLLGGILCSGMFFFHNLEGWGFLDSFTYNSVTFSTVGYGVLHPSTDLSRGWAIAFILSGVPLFGLLIGTISSEYSDEIRILIAD